MFSDVFLSAINDFIETTCHRLYPFQATNALQRNLPHHIRSRFCPLVKPINFIFFRDLQLMWWNFFSNDVYSQQFCGKFGQVTAGSVISKEPLLASMGRTLQPSPHKSYPRSKNTRQSTDTCSKRGSAIANNGVLNTESTLHLTSWTCFWYFRTDATVNFLGGRVVWSRIKNHIVQCIKKTNKQVYRHTPLIGAGIV